MRRTLIMINLHLFDMRFIYFVVHTSLIYTSERLVVVFELTKNRTMFKQKYLNFR